jgi:hypothetical protein
MSDEFNAADFESFMAEACESIAAGLETARRALVERGLSDAEAAEAIRAFPTDPYISAIARRAFRAFGGAVPPRRREMTAHASLADAMLDLHAQIVERFGDHPDTLEDLEIKTLPCPQEGSGNRGTMLVAYPRTGIGADNSNLLCAYFGPAFQPAGDAP